MRTEFSEFSYGFAITQEIIDSLKPSIQGAPMFPSLIEEAKLGFDVSFKKTGWPLYLQFKIPEYLTNRTAREYSFHRHPYWRISIRQSQRSQQHNLLVNFAKNEPNVYYATPTFHTELDFHNYYLGNGILTNSLFIPLSLLPAINDKQQHWITYSSLKNSSAYWHSHGSLNVDLIDGPSFLTRLKHDDHFIDLDVQYIKDFRNRILAIIREHTQLPLRSDKDTLAPQDLLEDTQRLLAVYFGVIPIFFQT